MKLETVHFDAYRSLRNESLNLTHNCIGLVGINESGKSNILRALGCLSEEGQLCRSDSPKMSRGTSPSLRFDFSLTTEEIDAVNIALEKFCRLTSVKHTALINGPLRATLHVTYDSSKQEVDRYFVLHGIQLPKGVRVLRNDANTLDYMVVVGGSVVPLPEAVLMLEADFKSNSELIGKSETSAKLYEQEAKVESDISNIEAKIRDIAAKHNETEVDETEEDYLELQEITNADPNAAKLAKTIERYREQLKSIQAEREVVDESLEEFDIFFKISEVEEELGKLADEENNLLEEISQLESELEELPESTFSAIANSDELKKSIVESWGKLKAVQSRLRTAQTAADSLNESLLSKYSEDSTELSKQLSHTIGDTLFPLLPRVVHWTHLPDYILQGETEFAGMLAGERLEDIARPLVNLFRIGLSINDLDELKAVITEIQEDAGERSRSQDRLNKKVDEYLKAVWPNYDQEIKIALEQERIRIQFFDPLCEDASYYDMRERSQGCQSFVSFLLTIGAEAKHGVISNTVLLLDEPETHLHPSGVRYMLKELKSAAGNDNVVVFATHSVFMIDREDYDRHAIVKKESEHTKVELSRKDRLGFFMQEEVLYGALDVDTTSEFAARPLYNIVVEGDGDATLFNRYYKHALTQTQRPFQIKKTRTYHGGKCSDILKYFRNKPIQLGATWVFLLDKDKPADELRGFLENRYRDFLGKYIFVSQYNRDTLNDCVVELEDLLPKDILKEAVGNAEIECGFTVDMSKIDVNRPYSEWFEELVQSAADQRHFKSSFKMQLNTTIEKTMNKTKTREDFEAAVPDYYKWVDSTIVEINKNLKMQ